MTEMAARFCAPLAPHAGKIAGSADRQTVRYVGSTSRSWLDRADLGGAVVDRVFGALGVGGSVSSADSRPWLCRPVLVPCGHDAIGPTL